MRILIYDNNSKDLEYLCEMLKSLPIESCVDKITDYNHGTDLYHKFEYDIVFIDFIDNIGKSFLEYILKVNSTQRIITISDVFECSEKMGCDFCSDNYNKERILKPINHTDIIKIFSDTQYRCDSFSNSLLLMQLKQIEKIIKETYSDYDLDVESLTFIGKRTKKYDADFFIIVEKLNTHKIEYSVDENSNIKVIDS